MDVRSKIVDQVLESLPELSADLRDRIERTLLTSLQNYEVQERCTEVAIHDNTNMGLVRKFIATKNWKANRKELCVGINRSLKNWYTFWIKSYMK